jgi:hypothetical protein
VLAQGTLGAAANLQQTASLANHSNLYVLKTRRSFEALADLIQQIEAHVLRSD